MVGAVSRRPVAVAVGSLVAWEQPIEDVDEIVVGAGSRLQDHEPGGGVRHEHVEQAVPDAGNELRAFPSDVEDAPPPAGMDGELGRLHASLSACRPAAGKS